MILNAYKYRFNEDCNQITLLQMLLIISNTVKLQNNIRNEATQQATKSVAKYIFINNKLRQLIIIKQSQQY